mmetsp:Transcript_18185/g.41063  ORF Transcript_18185/g.41063 Transcript_18185/m.41063 type:complete len:370 (-) Transcript_18185:250-1359(-)
MRWNSIIEVGFTRVIRSDPVMMSLPPASRTSWPSRCNWPTFPVPSMTMGPRMRKLASHGETLPNGSTACHLPSNGPVSKPLVPCSLQISPLKGVADFVPRHPEEARLCLRPGLLPHSVWQLPAVEGVNWRLLGSSVICPWFNSSISIFCSSICLSCSSTMAWEARTWCMAIHSWRVCLSCLLAPNRAKSERTIRSEVRKGWTAGNGEPTNVSKRMTVPMVSVGNAQTMQHRMGIRRHTSVTPMSIVRGTTTQSPRGSVSHVAKGSLPHSVVRYHLFPMISSRLETTQPEKMTVSQLTFQWRCVRRPIYERRQEDPSRAVRKMSRANLSVLGSSASQLNLSSSLSTSHQKHHKRKSSTQIAHMPFPMQSK